MIEIIASGPLSTIQDRGRPGLRHIGVPRAGAVAPDWMTLGNALVGNPLNHPVIESFEGGLDLMAVERVLHVAAIGDADIVLDDGGRRRQLDCWRSHHIPAGARLVIRHSGRARLTVIAIQGLSIATVLGSASTYTRAGLGGVDGRALAAGDRLCVKAHEPGVEQACGPCDAPFDIDEVQVNAMPGPQDDAFDDAVLNAFFETPWTLSAEADRMGARLEGPAIAHRDESSRDIVSDAIVPGSIQIPGNGQPIVMLADAHTAGGYPKIATLVSTDLSKFAICRPGTTLRINRIDIDAAIEKSRSDARALARHLASIVQAPAGEPDTERLLKTNLIDGVTDGRAEDLPCG